MTSEDQKILFEKLGKQMNYTLGLPNFKLINDVIYKLCTKCKKYKPMTSKFFPRRNNVKCGYGSHYKECEKEKESKRIRIPSFNENGELYCHVCKTYKDVSEFYKGEKYICRQGYSRECKDCEKERKKIKRATQEINDRDRFLSRLLSGCKTRALKNNIPFDLTKEQLIELFEKQNGKCALSNLEMQTVIKAGKNPFNVSIDRIKPGRAYSLSNIRLVCNSINTMRSNLSDEEFLSFCKAVVDYLSI